MIRIERLLVQVVGSQAGQQRHKHPVPALVYLLPVEKHWCATVFCVPSQVYMMRTKETLGSEVVFLESDCPWHVASVGPTMHGLNVSAISRARVVEEKTSMHSRLISWPNILWCLNNFRSTLHMNRIFCNQCLWIRVHLGDLSRDSIFVVLTNVHSFSDSEKYVSSGLHCSCHFGFKQICKLPLKITHIAKFFIDGKFS